MDCGTSTNGPETKRPGPGDFSLCLRCGEVLIYDAEMRLVIPTVQNLLDLGESNRTWLEYVQLKIRRERPLAGKPEPIE